MTMTFRDFGSVRRELSCLRDLDNREMSLARTRERQPGAFPEPLLATSDPPLHDQADPWPWLAPIKAARLGHLQRTRPSVVLLR